VSFGATEASLSAPETLTLIWVRVRVSGEYVISDDDEGGACIKATVAFFFFVYFGPSLVEKIVPRWI
jgi:hypothetical protein